MHKDTVEDSAYPKEVIYISVRYATHSQEDYYYYYILCVFRLNPFVYQVHTYIYVPRQPD